MTFRDRIEKAAQRGGQAFVFAMFGEIDPNKVLGTGETAEEMAQSFDEYLDWKEAIERERASPVVVSLADHRARTRA